MFDKILLATDGSENSFQALREAFQLGLLGAPAKVELINALSFDRVKAWGLGVLLSEEHRQIREKALEKIKPQVEWLTKHEVESKTRIMEATPEQCIPRVARLEDFDLIVVGRQSKGFFNRLTIGHVSQRILEQAEKPVLLVPAEDRKEGSTVSKTILVPTDFSDCSRQGFETAAKMAKDYGYKVHLIYCQSYSEFFADFDGLANHDALMVFWKNHRDDALEKLAALTKELTDQGIEASSAFVDDSVWAGLETVVQETGAALVVIASHGRGGWQKFWLGSVTERVLKHSSVPILVVKKPEATAP
ncbi:MAG: universal stress protein [Planctomycetota bacterium]|nr:universal stress protein [Planctomycetota bacterium]